MPRPLCLPNVPFGWYYLVRTAADGRQIVAHPAELLAFQALLAAAVVRAGAHLHFAHVDEKEVHLALHSGQADLNIELGRFFQRYSRFVNHHRRDKGALFRPHGRRLLIQQGKLFLHLGRYIHWIPHLRPRAQDAESLWWSTDVVYRTRLRVRGIVTSLTFRALSSKSAEAQVQNKNYGAFFDQRPTREEIEHFKSGSPEDTRMLGDPAFVADVTQRLRVIAPQRAIEWSGARAQMRRAIHMLIGRIQWICDENLPSNKAREWKLLITLDNLCSKRRHSPLPMMRGLSASYAIALRISTLRQAESFFRCQPGTLSAARRREYEQRFRDLFDRPHEDLFQDNSTAAAEAPRHSI